jgi:GLPGLI family protein
MKNIIKKIIMISLLISFNTYSQKNYRIDYSYKDRDNHTCLCSLFIVNNESIFKVFDEREYGVDEKNSTETDLRFVYNDPTSKIIFSDQKKSITRIPLYKNEIIYSDTNSKIKYELTGNKRKFNKHDSQEARILLNGRKYTIWFVPEIEIYFGPLKINGIPGLITELNEETNNINLKLKKITKINEIKTFSEYKKYIQSKNILDYVTYEKKIINLMIVNKKDKINKANELGVTLSFESDQNAFTRMLIDIPTNLVSELKKIKE